VIPAVMALVVLLSNPLTGAAQDQHLNLFLHEKSYAGLGTPDLLGAPLYYAAVAEPKILAEAQFVAHLSLHRGLDAAELRQGQGRGWSWNWFITPQFRLRGLDVPSGPVRSPSFMPKFTIQLLKSTGGQDDPEMGSRRVYGLNVVIGHHSNGGETCEFVDEDPNDACASSAALGTPTNQREVWVQGGNFSTNYVELGAGIRFGEVSDDPQHHWQRAVDISGGIQLHHNVVGFPLPGGPQDDFAELYGKKRLRVDVAAHQLVFANNLAIRGWARTDIFRPDLERFSGSDNTTFESELFLQRVDGLGDPPRWVRRIPSFVGIGIRYSRGMDYYNTQYARDISHLQFAVIVEPWSPRAR
jgi:hypothetical protein